MGASAVDFPHAESEMAHASTAVISLNYIKGRTTCYVKLKNTKMSKHPSSSNVSQFNPIGNTKSNEVQNQLKLAIKAEIDKALAK